eukprot:365107-Pleurochrysis_carterae.AAC.1
MMLKPPRGDDSVSPTCTCARITSRALRNRALDRETIVLNALTLNCGILKNLDSDLCTLGVDLASSEVCDVNTEPGSVTPLPLQVYIRANALAPAAAQAHTAVLSLRATRASSAFESRRRSNSLPRRDCSRCSNDSAGATFITLLSA